MFQTLFIVYYSSCIYNALHLFIYLKLYMNNSLYYYKVFAITLALFYLFIIRLHSRMLINLSSIILSQMMKKCSFLTILPLCSPEGEVKQKGPLVFEGKRIMTWLFPSGILQQFNFHHFSCLKEKNWKGLPQICECTPLV